MLSIGEFEKHHEPLIVVARFSFSCSLIRKLSGRNSEEDKYLEEINNEDRNACACSHIGIGRHEFWSWFIVRTWADARGRAASSRQSVKPNQSDAS